MLGLYSPVTKSPFTEHLKVFEEKAFILRVKNLKEAASRARDLTIREQNLTHSTEVVDIPTSFDWTWSSRGQTASRGIVTAIAEISCQVIDASYKCRVCNQCNIIEVRKVQMHYNVRKFLLLPRFLIFVYFCRSV